MIEKTFAPSKEASIIAHNDLINGRWRMNLNQSRIFLTAISMIKDTDAPDMSYRIQTKHLIDVLELKGHSLYNRMLYDVPALMKNLISVKTPTGFEYISIVTYARYNSHDGGYLTLKFGVDAMPYIKNLKQRFTECKLIDAMSFKSMYTLRFFLLIKQYESTGWRFLSLIEIREILDLNKNSINGLKKDKYPDYHGLKKRVLIPAIQELKSIDIPVHMEEKKIGREVVGINLSWKKTEELKKEITFNPKNDTAAKILEYLKKWKLSDYQIQSFLSHYKTKFTLQDLWKTIWAINQGIRNNNIPEHKQAGYAYKTISNKYFNGQNW